MAHGIISAQRVWLSELAIRDHVQRVGLVLQVATPDNTVLGLDTVQVLPGLRRALIEHGGLWDADPLDTRLAALVGAAAPWTVGVLTGAETETCYLTEAVVRDYTPVRGEIGDTAGFQLSLDSSAPLVRGALLAQRTAAASGSGPAVQLGAVGSGQRLYAALHLTALTGTSLAMKIQSAPTSSFSSPTDRLVFSTATGAIGIWATPVAGPITDTWWRATWTLTGTSSTFAVAAGIQ
jgi:hypothetical protein